MNTLKIKIEYSNGNSLEEPINWAHVEDGFLTYTVDRKVRPIFREPVKITLENVKKFEITRC